MRYYFFLPFHFRYDKPSLKIYFSLENKSNLDTQTERLKDYCAAKGLKVHKVVKEIGSGVNDNRQKLLKLLEDASITTIVVEHKDRLTRFGFNYIDKLLALQNRRIEVVNRE